MLTVFNAILPVFLVILLGYALRTRVFTQAEHWRLLDQINYFVQFPALLFVTLATVDLSGLEGWPLAFALWSAVGVLVVLLLLIRPALGLTGAEFSSVFQGSIRWNGFVALALVASLYGPKGIAVTAIAITVLVPTVNILSVIVLAGAAGKQALRPATLFGTIARNPLLLASLCGFLANVLAVPLPTAAESTLRVLGQAALSLGLLGVGASLDLSGFHGKRLAYLLTITLKLLVMPATIALMCLVYGIEGLPRTVAIICGAVPGATSAYVLARQMGGDAELMAGLVTISTLVSMATLPVLLYFLV